MEECVICCRASEGVELYSLSSGQLIKSIARPNSEPNKSSQLNSTLISQTIALLPPTHHSTGALFRISAQPSRGGLSVLLLSSSTALPRFIPPVPLTAVGVSAGGTYLAGGTNEGTILIWELQTGILITSIDAHYQPITQLSFTLDEGALVAASKDGAITVWSTTQLAGTGVCTLYCRLSDHTLAITAIQLGSGSFPKLRLLSASDDNTVKLWDLSVAGGALVSTFGFDSPVSVLALDKLERFFLAATNSNNNQSTLRKVNLYHKQTQFGYQLDLALGGGGRGDSNLANDATEYNLQTNSITALHLSPHSSTVILGTDHSQVHILALPSLLPTRIINPPPTTTSQGPVTFLTTLVRPAATQLDTQLGSEHNSSALDRPILTGGIGRVVRPLDWANAAGPAGRKVELKISQTRDVRLSIKPITISADRFVQHGTASSTGRESELEDELGKVRAQLAKAVGLNEAMWKKVVQAGLEQA